jgi:hypothetical protein
MDYIVDHTIIIHLINPNGKFLNFYGQTKKAESVTFSIMLQMKKWVQENKVGVFSDVTCSNQLSEMRWFWAKLRNNKEEHGMALQLSDLEQLYICLSDTCTHRLHQAHTVRKTSNKW